ncbi:LicD family protein [Neobacillus sp. Marseille-QA0830]
MDSNFINSEYRDEYWVDEKRKKLWKVELDTLEVFKNICEKYNLSYFLIGGAAIGAVRHGGFIPWDDDLDIGMLRKDYDKFVSVATKELKEPYFLQTPLTDKGYFCGGILRIRNSETTGIIRDDDRKQINGGIFIEIYPFDGTPDDELERKKHLRAMERMYLLLKIASDNNVPKRWYKKVVYKFLQSILRLWKIENLYSQFQNLSKKYSFSNTKCVDTPSLPYFAKRGIHKYPIEDVTNTAEVPFEYTNVSIPCNNDRCLRIHFGDYMVLPPVEERGIHHKNLVFYDPDKPYKEYYGKDLKEYFGA